MVKQILRHIKPQTVVGWTAGWLAAILLNAILQNKWDWKFWVALNGVLLIRVAIDVAYAWHEEKELRP